MPTSRVSPDRKFEIFLHIYKGVSMQLRDGWEARFAKQMIDKHRLSFHKIPTVEKIDGAWTLSGMIWTQTDWAFARQFPETVLALLSGEEVDVVTGAVVASR